MTLSIKSQIIQNFALNHSIPSNHCVLFQPLFDITISINKKTTTLTTNANRHEIAFYVQKGIINKNSAITERDEHPPLFSFVFLKYVLSTVINNKYSPNKS